MPIKCSAGQNQTLVMQLHMKKKREKKEEVARVRVV